MHKNKHVRLSIRKINNKKQKQTQSIYMETVLNLEETSGQTLPRSDIIH